MSKINKDKIIKEFEKGTTNDQIEVYHELGKWLHEQIEKKKQEAEELQLKLNGTKSNPL